MCGICGIINFNGKPVSAELLKKMADLLEHRGPDAEGYYIRAQVGMGMRRLSIIDLETGHQPIHNEDEKIWLVLNGEIYNFQELRTNLQSKGHKFYTKSDVETVVHLYEDYGVDCLKYINGMFAFALWDERRKLLFIARDRLGKKPLCYTWLDGSFYFASELKSFLTVPDFKREINRKAIHYYLTYQYIPSPMTVWQGVFRLPPASYLVLNENKRMRISRYWDIDMRAKTDLSFDESKERLRSVLEEATKLRMVADVPLGAFLSGGIDSSIVVGLMSKLSARPVKTFSIGFEEKEFSELKYARVVAKHFKTDHRELVVKPDYVDILPKIVWHYDQPYADSSALPSFFVSKMTRKYVKVALNGDGGDENFAGYMRYKAMKISQLAALPFGMIPSGIAGYLFEKSPGAKTSGFLRQALRFASALKNPPQRRNLIWHAYFTNEMKDLVYSEEMKREFASDDACSYLEDKFLSARAGGVIDRTLYTDLTAYLPECLLVKMDVATMANSLEARAPFLDYRFIEFTAALPAEWKLKGLRSKYILKESFRDFLPPEILNRGKQGFGIPLDEWFRGKLKNYIRDMVLSPAALKRGYFNSRNLRRFINDHVEGRANHGYRLWALLMLELWHRIFIDRDIVV
ncbi:MAG: asparagine synthase (glutamine-hydrolyzing) [bacterium]